MIHQDSLVRNRTTVQQDCVLFDLSDDELVALTRKRPEFGLSACTTIALNDSHREPRALRGIISREPVEL
jgi:hypothetical protein